MQCPSKNQEQIHSVLGIPMHKVTVRTKRLGGGFGGKESRAAFVNAAIAVPAWHLRRPVRVVLDRDEDMQIMGQRHAFVGDYKVRHLYSTLSFLLETCSTVIGQFSAVTRKDNVTVRPGAPSGGKTLGRGRH